MASEDVQYFKNGFVRFDGKWYEPKEYDKVIQARGYLKDGGKWYFPDEYDSLMVSRGLYNYKGRYLTRIAFIDQVIKPVFRSKANIEAWQPLEKIEVELTGITEKDIVYEVKAVSTAFL